MSIALKGDLELEVPIELDSSTKGVRSFSSSIDRKLATSIGYSYAGKVELEEIHSSRHDGFQVRHADWR